MKNVYRDIPPYSDKELFDTLLQKKSVKIERILSYGQNSPDSGWYDQTEDEWVVLLEGEASILFEEGEICELTRGDTLYIAAHRKHKVLSTKEAGVTIWLAVFFSA